MENRFLKVMAERSDSELIEITTVKRKEYQSEAVEAAEQELRNREISNLQIEKVKDALEQDAKVEIERKRTRKSLSKRAWEYLKVPSDLPGNIKWAATLIYVSILADIIRTVLIVEKGLVKLTIGELITPVTILYLLLVYLVHTGKNWARLGYVSWILTHLALVPLFLSSNFQSGFIIGCSMAAAMLLRYSAFGLLFTRKARAWYHQPNDASDVGSFLGVGNSKMFAGVLSVVVTLIFGLFMYQSLTYGLQELGMNPILQNIMLFIDSCLLVLIFMLWYSYFSKSS